MGKRVEHLWSSAAKQEGAVAGVYPLDLEAREGRALTLPSQGRAASPESTTYQSAQAKAWARRRVGAGQESQDHAMGQGGGAVQGAGYRRTKAKRHATVRHPQQGCAISRRPTGRRG